jgi:hypothetical protein
MLCFQGDIEVVCRTGVEGEDVQDGRELVATFDTGEKEYRSGDREGRDSRVELSIENAGGL